MSVPRICVVGSSNMDLISYVSHLPKRGETLRGTKFQTGFGGKGANQAVASALLGANVDMICKVGKDSFGDDMLKNFTQRGMSTECMIQSAEASTGVAAIAVAEDGANNIIIVSGTNDLLSVEEVEQRRHLIKSAKVLLTQLEIKLDTTIAALKIGKEEGVTTILNTAPAQPLPSTIYQYVDILSPNETELESLTGMSVNSVEDATKAAREIIKRGAKTVLVTLGEKGSLHVSADTATHVPVGVAVKAVDTTGAGDCFLGSFAYFLAKGDPIEECMKKANHAASISVTRLGTQTSFPIRSELPGEYF